MEKFFKISEVSKLFKTTNRQLRFYEEMDLLKPEVVDDTNGYRYYSKENCEQLKKILCLKDIGLSLSDISKYFSGNTTTQKNILNKYYDNADRTKDVIDKILKQKDFQLTFIRDIEYLGNDIRKKDLSKLKGTWKLSGVYSTIKDAKKEVDKIEKISPYRFMSFDEFGNSPWFYSADEQFVKFDTWHKPTKEIYQIVGEKLYLKIQNPKEHIFGNIENPIEEKHILVFDKFSDNYEDYLNFSIHDKCFTSFVCDKNFVGVWKLKEGNEIKYLIAKDDGIVDVCSSKGMKSLRWSKGNIYDDEFGVLLKYKINNKCLTLEKKTNIYVYGGIKGFDEEYEKI